MRNWSFPSHLQPKPEEVSFDLQTALDAVVALRAEVADDAYTAQVLGTERIGSGVVIADGNVLTIGYLITEAESVWLTTNDGRVLPAHPIAYDQQTGFGIVQPLGKIALAPLQRGSARDVQAGDAAIMIGHGGRAHALKTQVTDKREFAGYWEYVLDEAIFTAPAHPQWGGAALVDERGLLIGIGSLLVQESREGAETDGNMIVPVDLLEPIYDDMLSLGRAAGLPRPWLGVYVQEAQGQLLIGGLSTGGPAERAGVRVGDQVLEVAGRRVKSLAELFRRVWMVGPAGTEIPLSLGREGSLAHVRVRSADRGDFLKKPRLH